MEYIESFFALVGDLTWGWALVPMLIIVRDAMIGFIGLIIASKTHICNENGAFVT